MEMFLAIFVITFIMLILTELIWYVYEKYKLCRRFNEDYKIIIKTLPFIEEIIAMKKNSIRGEIVFNDLYFEYNNKEELISCFIEYISSALDLYEEISEDPLISASLEVKNNELKEIMEKLMFVIWNPKRVLNINKAKVIFSLIYCIGNVVIFSY